MHTTEQQNTRMSLFSAIKSQDGRPSCPETWLCHFWYFIPQTLTAVAPHQVRNKTQWDCFIPLMIPQEICHRLRMKDHTFAPFTVPFNPVERPLNKFAPVITYVTAAINTPHQTQLVI